VSATDVELSRTVFERLEEGGVEAVADRFHDDFEFTTPAGLASEPDTYRGVDGVRRWFDSFYEAMDEVRIEPVDLVDAGDGRVAVEFRLVARGRTSGIEAAQEAAMLVRLRDGLILRFEIVATLAEALALAGKEGPIAPRWSDANDQATVEHLDDIR